MANLIQIKTGTSKPGAEILTTGELGCDLLHKRLYIGQLKGKDPIELTNKVSIIDKIPQINELEPGEIAYCTKDKNIYLGLPNGGAQATYNLTVSGGKGSRVGVLPGTKVTIEATPSAGQTFTNWTVNGPMPQDFVTTQSKVSFYMPEGNLTITAHYSQSTYTITAISCTTNPQSGKAGDIIQVTANNPEPGYHFSYWSSNPTVTFANQNSASTTFTMINSLVEITANYTKDSVKTYSVSVYDGTAFLGESAVGSGSTSLSGISAGNKVTIKADSRQGQIFKEWEINSGTIPNDFNSQSSPTTFTMPASNLTLTCLYKEAVSQKYTVTIHNATFKNGVNSYAPGTKVEVKYSSFDGWTFTGWQTAPQTTVFQGDNGWYYFIMPESDIEVWALFEEGGMSPLTKVVFDHLKNYSQSHPNLEVKKIAKGFKVIDTSNGVLYSNVTSIKLSNPNGSSSQVLTIRGKKISGGENSIRIGFYQNGAYDGDYGAIFTSSAEEQTITTKPRSNAAVAIPTGIAFSSTAGGPYEIDIYDIAANPSFDLSAAASISEPESNVNRIAPTVRSTKSIGVTPYKIPTTKIDESLTQSGQAADAEITGQEIKRIDTAITNLETSVSRKMPLSGGTFSGKVTFQDKFILTQGIHYGTNLPSAQNSSEGQIFFKII